MSELEMQMLLDSIAQEFKKQGKSKLDLFTFLETERLRLLDEWDEE